MLTAAWEKLFTKRDEFAEFVYFLQINEWSFKNCWTEMNNRIFGTIASRSTINCISSEPQGEIIYTLNFLIIAFMIFTQNIKTYVHGVKYESRMHNTYNNELK